MPARGWLAYEELSKKRADLIALNIVGDRHGAANVDYTVNAITGFPLVTGPVGHDGPGQRRGCRRGTSPPPMPARWRSWRPSGTAGMTGQGPAHRAAAAGHGVGRDVGDRLHRRGGDQRGRPAALRQRDLRHLRPRLPDEGRPLRDDLHLLRPSSRGAGQRPAASPTPSPRSRRRQGSRPQDSTPTAGTRGPRSAAVLEPWVASAVRPTR